MRPRALLVCLSACGLGGGSGGGGDNLPISGAGPYGKLRDFDLVTPLDEPYLLLDDVADLSDPAPIAQAGAIRLFVTRQPQGGFAEIFRSDLTSLAEPAGPPFLVLTATQAWERGSVRAPSLVVDGDRLVLFYQGGDSGIGRAESRDGGQTFKKTGQVLDDATQPAALLARGLWRLYFTRPSRPGIFLATASDADGTSFTALDAPVLERRPGDGFDTSIGEPHAAGGETHAGTLRIALFFSGTDAAGLSAIGFAASADGEHFSRDREPILEPDAPAERAPGALLEPSRAVLFFAQDRSGRSAIAAATSP